MKRDVWFQVGRLINWPSTYLYAYRHVIFAPVKISVRREISTDYRGQIRDHKPLVTCSRGFFFSC